MCSKCPEIFPRLQARPRKWATGSKSEWNPAGGFRAAQTLAIHMDPQTLVQELRPLSKRKTTAHDVRARTGT